MTAVAAGWVTPSWLELRERADAAARSTRLVHRLRAVLPEGPLAIHDLGCGSGSMTRWLAPRLDGPQHWVGHDQDPRLLELAAETDQQMTAADGSAVSVETRTGDLARLASAELADAHLVTASALLDILTDQELCHLIDTCLDAGCPALFVLTVAGRVDLDPPDPWDDVVAEAFNAHQRQPARGDRLLGPDALAAARRRFAGAGAEVVQASSPWRLGPRRRRLTAAWLAGWVEAASEMRPDLRPVIDAYARRRRDALASGRLRVTVHHGDLLAIPRARARRR